MSDSITGSVTPLPSASYSVSSSSSRRGRINRLPKAQWNAKKRLEYSAQMTRGKKDENENENKNEKIEIHIHCDKDKNHRGGGGRGGCNNNNWACAGPGCGWGGVCGTNGCYNYGCPIPDALGYMYYPTYPMYPLPPPMAPFLTGPCNGASCALNTVPTLAQNITPVAPVNGSYLVPNPTFSNGLYYYGNMNGP